MELQVLNLRAEAVDEAQRLSTARTYAARRDSGMPRPGPSGVLVARAHRHATRRRLAGRMLLIFGLSCSDGSGRPVAAHLIAVLCTLGTSATDRRRPDRVRDAIAAALVAAEPHVQRAAAKWTADNARVVRAVADACVRREHAIVDRSGAAMPRPFQGGLFDRRAERARAAEAALAGAREDEQRAHLQTLEQCTALQSEAELRLVLVP